LKNFFIPLIAKTYGKNAVYIFVDFRIKRAGSSNYGGLMIFDLRLTIDYLRASLSFSAGRLTVLRKQESMSFDALDSTSSAE
jgi:hypothetical protein